MAIAHAVSTDILTRTTTLPPTGTFSMLAWAYCPTINTTYAALMAYGVNSDAASYWVGTDDNGTYLITFTPAGVFRYTGTVPLTAATWFHVALVVAGTSTDQVSVYMNGGLDHTNDGVASTGSSLCLGNVPDHGAVWTGRFGAVKIYSAVLTPAEIVVEMQSYMPVRLANLNTWSPLLDVTDLGNLASAGAGTPWTPAGTPTTQLGPPISWALYQLRMRQGVPTPPFTRGMVPPVVRSQAVANALL